MRARPREGSALEGRVRGLARDGDAVVETARGLVFAPGGLPGERVRVEEPRKEGKVLRARRLEVLEASASRVEPPCTLAARCGGCPWMHASADAQLAAKRDLVVRALARVPRSPGHAAGGVAGGELPISITSPDPRLGYRRRARLAWRGPALGFRARRADTVTDVERCVVLVPALDAALGPLRAELRPHLPGAGEIHLALGAGGRPVAILETEAALPRAAFAALERLVAEGALAGASVRAGGASVPTLMGDPRERGVDPEGRALVGAIGGFSQAHAETNAAIGASVLELAAPEGARVLELYAGHGNLTMLLAARAAHVRAVELSPGATEALVANLEAHGLLERAQVITMDAAAGVPPARRGERFDVVVLDPPRTGAKEVLDALAGLRPTRVVYVSCDPATLGRDLERLGEHGFALDTVRAFDMFPQTLHVEVVARMIRT
jgi:23S rRNA (uracil1939-C5)-methyltransferase